MNYVISLAKEIVRKRKMILDLSKADFRKRFVGSYFGVVWMFLQPLVTVAIYWFIFGEYGMKTTPPGLVPWFFYSEALNAITGCLEEYNYLVKKVVFQVEVLPLIKLSSCLMVHGFFILIMLALYGVTGQPFLATWVQILYYTFAAAAPALAIGYFTSAVNVFFKDMANIVGICLQFGIWLTPIMYDEAIFTSRAPWVATALKLNPFYYIVAGYRDSMLTGHWFWERPTMTLYYWGVTIVVMLVGLKMFKRLRPHFSDVL